MNNGSPSVYKILEPGVWSLQVNFCESFFFIWAACSESYSVATGEACDCSGNSCTDAEFCYDGACNSNARGIP